MQKYEKYKDSGVKWLGLIPEHWTFVKLKNYCKDNKVKNKDNQEKCVLSLSYGKIIIKQNIDFGLVPENYENYQIVNPGNIILRLTDLQNDHKSLRTGYVKDRGIITSAYTGLIVEKINSLYVQQVLHAYDVKKVFYGLGDGLRQSMSYNDVAKLYIPVPPLREQQTIVSFLDSRTSKIDSYVADKEREIALLEDTKKTIIADAVTKGINPDVKLKDSGIKWLGEIPEHWALGKAKYMFTKNKRPIRPEDEVITCFRDGQVTLRKNRRTTGFTESLTEIGYQGVRKGDLVIHQMDAFAGAIGVSDSDGKGTSVYHCCTPKGDYDTTFYSYFVRTMAKSGYIQSLYRGIRERSSDFNFATFGKQYLVIPPLSEQQQIVGYIESKVTKIDNLIADIKLEIEKIKEYKQRLISDVVTGQIKVC